MMVVTIILTVLLQVLFFNVMLDNNSSKDIKKVRGELNIFRQYCLYITFMLQHIMAVNIILQKNCHL